LHVFNPSASVEDFTHSDAGSEKLDAICMQFIAIGESLKKVDAITSQSLLSKYPQIDWKTGETGKKNSGGKG
jgi:uncharacterized protein with HEPN domain